MIKWSEIFNNSIVLAKLIVELMSNHVRLLVMLVAYYCLWWFKLMKGPYAVCQMHLIVIFNCRFIVYICANRSTTSCSKCKNAENNFCFAQYNYWLCIDSFIKSKKTTSMHPFKTLLMFKFFLLTFLSLRENLGSF